jgi:hypothetical protein
VFSKGKSKKPYVIPAQAGIQVNYYDKAMAPRFRGDDNRLSKKIPFKIKKD